MTNTDIRTALGLRPVINVSGTMTGLGASIAVPEAAEAAAKILPQFVEINDLQRKASEVIAQATGAEAGFVTASCSAGITLTVAGAMTGDNIAAIEMLPDRTGPRNEVAIQMGHIVSYGAPVDQAIRLSGAVPVMVGQATSAYPYHLEGALTERTAAAVYVVSHHVVQYGLLPLRQFAEIAHARGVPVMVDAASEYDLRGFLEAGADVVLYSGHKFLGGPTSGIVAGRKDLVRNAFLQNLGIGRGMKVGKESIFGVMAALEAWDKRDATKIRAREAAYLELWREALAGRPGITAMPEADPTGNPLDRLRVTVDPVKARITAWDLVDALAAGDPPVIARDHEVEHGYFYLDPCNLHPGQEITVVERIRQELDRAQAADTPIATQHADRAERRLEALRRWPD